MKPKRAIPLFQGIQQASSASGVPVHILRSAKKSGAPGFDASRVDLPVVLAWLFQQQDSEASIDWTRRLKRAQAMREELDLAKAKGELVAISDVKESAAAAAARVRSILDGKLRTELPARLGGRPAEEIAAALEVVVQDAFAEINKAGV